MRLPAVCRTATVLASLLTLIPFALGQQASPSLQPPRFVFVVEAVPNGIYGFAVDPTTGILTPTAQGLVQLTFAPSGVASDQGGHRLYVGDLGGNVSGFNIDAGSGFLSAVPGSPFAAGDTISGIAVYPFGKFVFASLRHGGVAVFRAAATGALTEVPDSPFPTVTGTNALTLSQGSYLFIAEGVPGAQLPIPSYIDGFAVDPTTGALTAVPNSPYQMNPVSDACSVVPKDLLAVSGRYLYVADAYESAVSGFAIGSTGALTELKNSPYKPICADNTNVNNLNQPAGITVEPTHRFLYGADASPNSVNLAAYRIRHSGDVGTLAFLTTTASSTNCGFKLRADPSGKFVYGFGNTSANCSGAPVLSAFAIDSATGQLTPITMPANVLGAPVDLAVTPPAK